MQTLCREYTLLRDQETSRARGWIRGKTKIGPVLDVKVYFHQGRYCIDIMIESLIRDRTVSWVHVVNGINKLPKRHKKFLLQVLRTEVQGNLSRRLSHDRSLL